MKKLRFVLCIAILLSTIVGCYPYAGGYYQPVGYYPVRSYYYGPMYRGGGFHGGGFHGGGGHRR